MRTRALLVCCGLALSIACAPEVALVTDAPLEGPYAVAGARIVDARGAHVLLRGVNLSQSAKSAPFLPEETAHDDGRAALRAHGPVAIRFLTSWAAIEPEDGVIDDAYLSAMGAQLEALSASGHMIVLDLHQDLFGVGFAGGNGAPRFACDEAAYASFTPVTPWFQNYRAPEVQGCFDALFSNEALLSKMALALRRAVEVAREHAGPHLVGVDLINEPHPGSLGPAQFDERLFRYYEIAAEALADLDVMLFFEPNVMHNLGEDTTFTRAPSARAVFAPHLYPFDAELGRYADASALAAQIAHFADEAHALEVPLAIGELGPLLTDPARLDYVDDALYILDVHGAGAFAWDWSATADRGLLREGGEDVAVRMLRPHARRIGGAFAVQSFDPETASLHLEFEESGVDAPTEIVWPAAWGALGADVDVEVSDGEVLTNGDVLRWRHAPASQRHTLTARRR